jgi:hypothetical protein
MEALVEFVALAILGLSVAGSFRPMAMMRHDSRWSVLILAVLVFPVLQLVPLPPAVWTQFPGREAGAEALAAVGRADAWQSWSILPDGGVAALLALIPAIVIALLVARMPLAGRVRLVAWLAILGGLSALVGVLQFIRGFDRPLSLWADVHRGWGIGFFANRNAQADLIAIALIAGVLLAHRYRDRLDPLAARAAVATALLLGLIAGIATGSRMGIAVLTIPVALAIALSGRRAPGLTAALAGAAALLLLGGTALDRVTDRASDPGNRVEIWGDSWQVARDVAPIGAGMGSFVPLYMTAERLEHVQRTIANRAHNDYLELAIEGGLPALALLAAVLAFVAVRAWRGWRDPDPDRRLLARFAGLVALVFAVHATVDYPLRTLTLLTIAGLAMGGLAFAPSRPQEGEQVQGAGGSQHA